MATKRDNPLAPWAHIPNPTEGPSRQAVAAPAPASAPGQSAAAQALAATEIESAGTDPTTGFEQFRKRKTTGGGSSASAATLGF